MQMAVEFPKAEDEVLLNLLSKTSLTEDILLKSVRFAFLGAVYAAAVRCAIRSPHCEKASIEPQQNVEREDDFFIRQQISRVIRSEYAKKLISVQLDVRDARQCDKFLTSRPPLGCWAFLHDEEYGLDLDCLPDKDVLSPRKSYCFSLGVSGESFLGSSAGIFFIWLDPKNPMANNNVTIFSSSSSSSLATNMISVNTNNNYIKSYKEKGEDKFDETESNEFLSDDSDGIDDERETTIISETLSIEEKQEHTTLSTTTSTTISSKTANPPSPSLSVKLVSSPDENSQKEARSSRPKSHQLPAKYVRNIRNFSRAYSSGDSIVFNGLQCALAVAEASCYDRFNVPFHLSLESSNSRPDDESDSKTSSITGDVSCTTSLPLCIGPLVRHHPERMRLHSNPSLKKTKTKTLWNVYELFAGGKASSQHVYHLLGKKAFEEYDENSNSLQNEKEDRSSSIRWINCCDIARLSILWLLGGGSTYLDTDMLCPTDLLRDSTSFSSYDPSYISNKAFPTMSRLLPPSLVSRSPFQKVSTLSSLLSQPYSSTSSSLSTNSSNEKENAEQFSSGPVHPTLFVAQDADGVLQNNFFALADGVSSTSSSTTTTTTTTNNNKYSALHHPLLSLLLQAIISSALEESHVIHATGPALVTAVFHAFRKTLVAPPSSSKIDEPSPASSSSCFAALQPINSPALAPFNDASIPFWCLPRVSEDAASFVHFKTLLLPEDIMSNSHHKTTSQSVTLGDTVWILPPSCFFSTHHWRDMASPLTVPSLSSIPFTPTPSPPPPVPSVSAQAPPSTKRFKIPSSLRSASIPLPPANFGFFGPVLPDASMIRHGSNALTPKSLQRSLGREGNLRGRREQQQQQQQQQKMCEFDDNLNTTPISTMTVDLNPSLQSSSLLPLPLSISVPHVSLENNRNLDFGDDRDYMHRKDISDNVNQNSKEQVLRDVRDEEEEEEEREKMMMKKEVKKEGEIEDIYHSSTASRSLSQDTTSYRRQGGGGGGGGGQVGGGGSMPPALHGFGPLPSPPPPFVWIAPSTTTSTSTSSSAQVTNGRGGGGGGDGGGDPPIFGYHNWDCTWGKSAVNGQQQGVSDTQQHPYAAAFSLPLSSSNYNRSPSLFPYSRAMYYAAATHADLHILFPLNRLTSTELLIKQATERQDAVIRATNNSKGTSGATASLYGGHFTEADARFAIQERRRHEERGNGGDGEQHKQHESIGRQSGIVDSRSTFNDIFGVSFLAKRVVSRLADSGLPALPPKWAVKLWLSGDEAGDLQGSTQRELIETISRIVEELEIEEKERQRH